jgi:integrase
VIWRRQPRWRPASKITTADIQQFIAQKQEKGASNEEINRELAALKRAFTLAIQTERISRKPHIPRLKKNNVRKGFFEPWQFEAVLPRLPDFLRPSITFAYWMGWRFSSEVLSLTWDLVDLDAGTVRLHRGSTKNKDGRVIALPQELRDLLEHQWKEYLTLYPDCPFVFQRHGKRIKDIRGSWERACREAGLSGKIPHDFRRTAVRNLVRAGVPERVAMIITGHKTLTCSTVTIL